MKNTSIISFNEGETIFIKYIFPDNMEKFASKNKAGAWVFNTHVVALVEGLHESQRGCKHMRCVRRSRPEAQGLGWTEIRPWPKMRVALKHANLPSIHVSGGFEKVIVYSDEIAVPDFAVTGSHGWVILRKEIKHLLKALPPLPIDSGINRILYSESCGEGSPDTFNAVIHGGEYPDEPLMWYNRAEGCLQRESPRQLVKVTFDERSLLVKQITNVSTGKIVESTAINYSGVNITCATVGERLPKWAAQNSVAEKSE